MFDILFSNITVITMDDARPVLQNAYVGVSGKHIMLVEDMSGTGAELKAKRVIDGTNKLIMPGLINSHTHTAMTLLRGYADDKVLQDWLYNFVLPAEARLDERALLSGQMLGYAEAIAGGTTSLTDMYFHVPACCERALEVGVRTNICNGPVSFDLDTYDFEKDRAVTELRELLKSYHMSGDGRIKADASIHAEYTSYPAIWEKVVDIAAQNDLNIHLHLSETKREHEECVKKYGKTPAGVFQEAGVFTRPVTAAHCVWVSDGDVDILASNGATAVHNPVSNLKLASGIAPVAKLLAKGVNVTLGTDGCSSNNTLDMFEEIKTAALLHKCTTGDPTVLSAYEALKLATVNGAKGQGRADTVGVIKEGMEADIIMLDMDKPHLCPSYDPVSTVVYCARGGDVALTMVQGKILYENGEYKTLDIQKVTREAIDYGVKKILE